jgi:hypothetical protein
VRGRSLDAVCEEQGISQVALLRMNIEGAEQFAIQGMDRVIANTAHAAIACHDFKADRTGNEFFRTKKRIAEFLARNGFEVVELAFDEPWAKDHVYAFNPSLTTNPCSARQPQ